MLHLLRRPLPLLLMVLVGCPKKTVVPDPPPVKVRCEVDLDALGIFSAVGSGAVASQVTDASQLIGGEMAQGAVGDYLMENDKVRVVIQRPLRALGPNPFGGAIIDADLKRPPTMGRDQLGKVSLLYQFGRIINASTVEVLRDGSQGGFSVVAATGDDTLNDFINLPSVIGDYAAGVQFVTSPETPVPFHATTYFVLSPGESRVRMLTAFCNTGHDNAVVAMGDLFEQGGSTDFFNPTGCTNGMGVVGCLIDPTPWFGFQGESVAYALRSFKVTDATAPEPASALISFTGAVGTVAGGQDQAGLLKWLDPAASNRPGSFGVLAGQSRNYLRDLHIGRDLAEITSQFASLDASAKSRLDVTVTTAAGAPAPDVRVAVILAADGVQQTLMITDAQGKAKADLHPGNYRLVAGQIGSAIEPATAVTLPSSGEVSSTLKLGATRTLNVTVRDEHNAPMPGKVTVLCPGSSCQTQMENYRPFFDVDRLPSNVAAYSFVGASGNVSVAIPPGQYEVLVSRGPEYSGWPDSFPDQGQPVDLTAGDQSLAATLIHVVDTTGWISADLHVHAVNSADCSVPNNLRVASFAAEGVDVLVSTDHDFITDYAPMVSQQMLQPFLATMIGSEVSPFDYGHQNAYPLTRKDTPNGGAFDWAGGDGPTLRLEQVYSGLRAEQPGVVLQMNHPRGRNGSLTALKVDTATLATHADPAQYRMEPNPAATANDTKLLSDNFDAMEVMNGPSPSVIVMNDWMTFLSRGSVKTATAVSDSHQYNSVTGGYGRTWVKTTDDAPSAFASGPFAESLRAHHAVGGSGPFVRLTAQRLDSNGAPVGGVVDVGDTISVNQAGGEKLQLTVDVQAPVWMTFDSIEVYTHTSGREAVNGVSNETWPPGRVLQSKALNPTMMPIEAVPGTTNGRRIHVSEKFTVSPTGDTWYVVMVRGSTASHPLFPLVMDGVDCNSNGVCSAGARYPAAYTNAILVDGDGSGKYDDYPLKGQPLSAPVPVKPVAPRHVPTMAELSQMIRALMAHKHE